MDLNLEAFVGITYLVPIAITLRKVYAPSFDMPEAFTAALAKIDTGRKAPLRKVPHYAAVRRGVPQPHDLHV